jgi:hypothetical protein
MSNSPQHETDRISPFGRSPPSSLHRGAQLVAAPLRFVGFWLAVALPFLYVPLLVGGLSGGQLQVFVGLLGLNVLALLFGHSYGR